MSDSVVGIVNCLNLWLMHVHGHHMRGRKGMSDVCSSSNGLHDWVGRCEDHTASGCVIRDGCRRSSGVKKLWQTVLDDVLLRDKTPWAVYRLVACPSRNLDLGTVKPLLYVEVENSFEKMSALYG